MITPQLTANPHLSQESPDTPGPTVEVGTRLKTRYLTYSPDEEYAVRDGETESLSPEFLAMLCGGWHGTATCTLKGVLVKNAELVGFANRTQGVRYHSPDSIMCNQLAQGDQKIRYTFNPSRPGVIHIHDLKGRYIETLPAVGKIGFLDTAALKGQARKHQAQIQHAADHMQRLHQESSTEAVDRLSQAAAEMDRVANQIQLPAADRPRPAADTPQARMTAAAERITEQQHRRAALVEDADDIIETRRANTPATVSASADIYDPFDI